MRFSRAAILPVLAACAAAVAAPQTAKSDNTPYDVLISGGTVYDGAGGKRLRRRRRYSRRSHRLRRPQGAPGTAREHVDAHGKAVAPGFINMLAHPEESLLVDGRALSDLRQGVTLEVIGEDSMGPLNAEDEAAHGAAPG